jgi:putative nucleotidyltransferase with HDIG domain
MSAAAVGFLNAFAQTMSALSLYPEGHTARERVLDMVYGKLRDLIDETPYPSFSFLGEEVIFGNLPLREFRSWSWSERLSAIGIQRLQFEPDVTRDELEAFLDELLARITLQSVNTSEARQMRRPSIRYGAIGLRGSSALDSASVTTATLSFSLQEEADAVQWIHHELAGGGALPLSEAEAVVRALTVAMHGDQQIMLPLLQLRGFDEYTTTHSLNVCVLAMALAEWMGLGARDVRAFGVAGLLHDLGKVKIPKEILNKAGKLTLEERAIMNDHPVEGARVILASEPDLDLAAVVAYEHHVMLNGGGYPSFKYPRDCHRASKFVHVCDVYDALRTNRPYREAWPSPKVLAYIEERSGIEFDGEIAHAFTQMMREWEPQMTMLADGEQRQDAGYVARIARP